MSRIGLTLLLAGFLLGGYAPPGAAVEEPAKPTVKLVVLIYVDQMRGDYLARWHDLYGTDGFHRLEKDGAWFQNCHYPYAATLTAVGHASVVTGVLPSSHGIVANEWFDRIGGEEVNCVDSARAEQVPPAEKKGKKKGKGSGSPDLLLVDTVADWLKKASPQSRVVTMALKDRSAVLPGGRRPDACYWFNTSLGGFVTSTYYRDRLHPWVEAYNQTSPADAWFDKPWKRLNPDLDYTKHSGPDDGPGESIGILQGKTFPHRLDARLPKPTKLSREAALCSPLGNDMLLDLAKRAIEGEKLGQRDAADFLSISFSSNDLIGHAWGPDSHEVLDITMRTDRVIADLLGYLDTKVGSGKYALVLTADHGVCPLPEASRGRGEDAMRLSTKLLASQAEEFLDKQFPAAGDDENSMPLIEDFLNNQVYLNAKALKARKLESAKVETTLAGWFKEQPGVLTAFTQADLQTKEMPTDSILRKVRASFHSQRSGDVLVVTKPKYLAYNLLGGTSHGSPHAYDTHVPLLVFGPGLKVGSRKDEVTPLAAAAIAARFLGVPTPAGIVPIPQGLFAD